MDASDAGPQLANAARPASSLRRPALQLLVATGSLLFSVLLVMQDLTGANRPHELHNAPWVAGITLLNLLPCAKVLTALVRYARGRRGIPDRGFVMLVLGLIVVAALDVWILAGAVSVLPAVLDQ